MAADEREALDVALDALIANAQVPSGTIADEDLTMLRRLHVRWQRPTPDPRFAHRLRSELLSRAIPAATAAGRAGAVQLAPSWPSRRVPTDDWRPPRKTHTPARRLSLAFAGLAICVALVAFIMVALARGDDERRTIPAGEVASPPASSRAVLLVIDVSGSMSYDPLGGTAKIEMVKTAARGVLDQLAPGDWFGVLAFNDRQTWTVPLGPLTDEERRREAAAAIAALQAEGGTEIYPALAAGIDALRVAPPADKQLVLVTDGKSRTGTRDEYRELVAPATEAGIVISTVAVGNDADADLMQFLAEIGGGRYHLAARPEEIPEGVAVILDLPIATPEAAPAAPDAFRPAAVVANGSAPRGHPSRKFSRWSK